MADDMLKVKARYLNLDKMKKRQRNSQKEVGNLNNA